MRKMLLAILWALFAATMAHADVTAASCNNTTANPDISNAIASLTSDGQVVNVPAGLLCSWSKKINSTTYQFTLKGAGTDPLTGTVVYDDFVGSTASNSGIQATCPAGSADINHPCRITGFRFKDGAHVDAAGHIWMLLTGSKTANTYWRVDNNVFDQIKRGHYVRFQGAVGVYDHNVCNSRASNHCVTIFNETWGGGSCDHGDCSWTDPIKWGDRTDAIYLESNTVAWNGDNGSAVDGWNGSRAVMRFNSLTGSQFAEHGTDSSERDRSGLYYEVYGNALDMADNVEGTQILNWRGGTFRLFENKTSNWRSSTTPRASLMVYDRAFHKFSTTYFGQATGVNQADDNDPLNPYATATVDSFNSTTRTVTVTPDPMWSPADVWKTTGSKFYTVRKTSTCTGSTVRCAAPITGSTSNTLTFGTDPHGGQTLTFAAGNTLEINSIITALDQPGVAGGGRITGGTPVYPSGWYDQDIAPIYAWRNTDEDNASAVIIASTSNGAPGLVRSNVTFYNEDTAACISGGACPTGIGRGTSLPTTCTAGVAYWKTDEGTWNGNTDPTYYTGQGRLRFCVTDNVWSTPGDGITYEPLVFPHPIVTAAAGTPVLSLIVPDFGVRSTTVPVVLTGNSLDGTCSVNISGTGVTVQNTVCVGESSITSEFVIAAGATVSTRSVTATVDGVTSNAVGFEVQGAAEPTLTSITPSEGLVGASVPIAGVGTNLNGGSPVLNTPCTGITSSNLDVSSATNFTATIILALDASLSACDVTITTSAGTSNAVAFQPQLPTPGSGPRGAMTMRGGR